MTYGKFSDQLEAFGFRESWKDVIFDIIIFHIFNLWKQALF